MLCNAGIRVTTFQIKIAPLKGPEALRVKAGSGVNNRQGASGTDGGDACVFILLTGLCRLAPLPRNLATPLPGPLSILIWKRNQT